MSKKNDMNISGIYKIQSISKPERCYIGSAVNIHARWKKHLQNLTQKNHHSKKLQYHYNKYGEADLAFSVLISCDKDALITHEQFFIDSHNPYFNTCKIAGSCLGMKMSKEAIEKIRKVNTGKKHSEATKRKLSEIQKGRKLSIETRLKQKEWYKRHKHPLLGTHASESTKKLWSEHRKGKRPTEETRRKISEANKGRPCSEETKRKISDANKGKRISEEHKQRLREYFTGRPKSAPDSNKVRLKTTRLYGPRERKKLSEEHKYNISMGLKGYKHSDEFKQKIRLAKLNQSEETRRKISLANKGRVSSNKGVKQSQEVINKRIESRRRNSILKQINVII